MTNLSLRWRLATLNRRIHATSRLAYWGAWLPLCRYVEYDAALGRILTSKSQLILDVGSGDSPFPLFLAQCGLKVITLDLDVSQQYRMAKVAGMEHLLQTDGLAGIVGDAQHMSFDADSFDIVSCISVLEHIPGNGDSVAMQEVGRVLRPGGVALITVPFAQAYREAVPPYVDERSHRVYDRVALTQRIIEPSDLRLEHVSCFGTRSAGFAVSGLLRLQQRWLHVGVLRMPNILIPSWIYGPVSTDARSAEGVFLVLAKREC